MSEFESYASKDLKRRPFRSSLVLISLTCIIASTTFIFLFGNVLLDVSTISSEGALTSSMGMFFSTFVWSVLLLVFCLGIVVVSATISLEMVTRRRDIGLMKAVGTTLDSIFDFFMAQSVIILLASIVLGIVFGTVLYLLGMIWLGSIFTGLHHTDSFPILQIGVLAVVYLIAGYFSAQKPIYDTVQESPSLALNPEVGTKVTKSGFLDSFGLSFRIAAKGTGRRIRGTRRTVISLFLSFTIASLLWIGGGIVETTSQSYMMRSMGTNVVAIGNPTLLDRYYDAYTLYGTALNDSFNFLDSANMINDSMMLELEDVLDTAHIETRLVVFSDVQEGFAYVWNDLIENYETIGEGRTGSTALIGVDWENTISDWYYEGSQINGSQQAWIGGALAENLFVDPLIQSLRVQGGSLDIQALVFDTFNGGNLAILDINDLRSYFGVTGSNIVLIQLESYDSTTINQIQTIAQSFGMSVYRQEDVLHQNYQAIHAIWVLLNPLAIMALVSAFLGLMNYLLVSVFGRLRDYVIMKSIGAKPSFIAKVMIAEGLDVGVRAGIPALLVGTLLSIYSLIPDAAVPTLAYIPGIVVVIFLAIILVILLASVPVYVFFNSRTDLRVSEFSS